MVLAAGILGTLLAKRLVPDWRGAPLALASLVASLASVTVVAMVVGLPGLFSSWAVVVVLGLLAVGIALLVPVPPGTQELAEHAGPGDRATAGQVALAALPVGLGLAASLTGAWGRVGTGMTGFDSTWYHGPIAAELVRTGETFSLHFTTPQFLTWFYPHGSELLHAVTGSAWGGDLPSLFLNSAFLAGALFAAWVIARPFGGSAGPVSVAGVALVLGCSAAFADQFGEARNDLAGAFFLLAGIAALVARERSGDRGPGSALLVGLAAGMAAGTKLNFVPAAVVLIIGPAVLATSGNRLKTFAVTLGGGLLTGGFWYLRNLVQAGNPLPWTAGDRVLGIELPGPVQETGGREAGSVLDYALDGTVISDWFIPGLADGFGPLWPIVLLLGLAGVFLALFRPASGALRLGAVVALAIILAWLVGPTSASGPEGEPLGFVSGLRYLVPGLAIGFALLGPAVRSWGVRIGWVVLGAIATLSVVGVLDGRTWDWVGISIFFVVLALTFVFVAWNARGRSDRRYLVPAAVAGAAVLVVVGLQVASRYDRDRYREPTFTVPGLDRAFAWADSAGPGPIASTATRSYPFRGDDLSRRVDFPGVRTASGGLIEAGDCRAFRRLVNLGRYRYLVLSLDREGVARDYPEELTWVSGDPAARPIFRQPPTAVFELEGPLDPDGCR
ncbi:MAG: hypothetical protein ACO3CR_03440 [Solirubrobacterales bacterium]